MCISKISIRFEALHRYYVEVELSSERSVVDDLVESRVQSPDVRIANY